jgi:lysophospholipase L1-like esterase
MKHSPNPSLRLVRLSAALALVAFSAGVGVVLAEVGLRAFQPQIFPVHPPGMYTPNPPFGNTLTAGFTGSVQRAEFDASFRVNSAGFRGPELRPRQANTVRIVALGDSQTFGFGVADDETFTVQLERILSQLHPETDFQVVNTGTPGFGTYHQLHLLDSRWEELDPDLVMLQFLPVNDFLDNRAAVRALHPEVREGMLTEASAAPTRARPPAWMRIMGWSKANLHVARLASENIGYVTMRLGLARNVSTLWGEDFSREDERLTQELLEQVASRAHQGGARMVFLYSTAKVDLMGAEYRVPRSRAVIERAAAISAASWIDLNQLMREHERPHRFFFVRDGHWSPAGHRIIAEILSTELQRLALLPRTTDRGTGAGMNQTSE